MKHLEISRRALIASGIGSFATCLVGNSWIEALAAGEQTPALPNEGGLGPWNYWLSDEGTGVVRIASAAILSANPRDIQPWLFRLSDKQIEILADNKVGLRLGALDAIQREVYIGLGCAVENACVAAPSQGLKAEVLLLPDPARTELAAVLKFQAVKPAKDRHYDAIAIRHTNRTDYIDRPIEPATMDALTHEASSPDAQVLLIEAASPEGQMIADVMIEGTKRQFDMPAFSDLLGAGARRNLPKDATPADIAASLSKAAAQSAEGMRKSCATAACFGLIMVRGSRLDHRLHLEAGRLWQRIHLEGSTRSLGMQPLNHPIQIIDYEVATHQRSDMRTRLLKLPGNWNGWEPIFGFRFGYVDSVAPSSARRPLSAVVIS